MEIEKNVKSTLDNIVLVHKKGGNVEQAFADPTKVIEHDLQAIIDQLPETVRSDDAMVNSAAKYFFKKTGKMFRPTVILLVGRASNPQVSQETIGKVRKLAEVTEMIHVASLIHDDIIDKSDTRRGVTTLHKLLGTNIAVQAGDYLLARACYELANLENHSVSKCIARSIEHLATGEISQLANKGTDNFESYMNSIYFKTASIIAHSSEAAALFTCDNTAFQKAAYTYGKHLGIAYQLIDDALDFTQTAAILGKPSHGADMTNGLATAPVIFATEEYPEIKSYIQRKFEKEGDVEKTWELVQKSAGIEKTQQLAFTHCRKAMEAALAFPASDARTGLIALVDLAMKRKH